MFMLGYCEIPLAATHAIPTIQTLVAGSAAEVICPQVLQAGASLCMLLDAA